MRYYLDFDRTVFDTDSFIPFLKERPEMRVETPLSEKDFLTRASDMAKDGSLVFEPGELSRFLFPDAASFLREKENAVTLITFGGKAFQEIKVKSALFGIPRMSVMYTDEVRKGVYLAPYPHLHTDAVFVDDMPLELEILQTECPSLTLFEIRRDGREGDGRWPVLRLLSELP